MEKKRPLLSALCSLLSALCSLLSALCSLLSLLGKLSKSAMILLVLALGAGTGHVSIVTAGTEASTFGVVGAIVNTKEGMTGSKFM